MKFRDWIKSQDFFVPEKVWSSFGAHTEPDWAKNLSKQTKQNRTLD